MLISSAIWAISLGGGAVHAPESCSKTYTDQMIRRAIDSTYIGIQDVTEAQKHRLTRYIFCARNQNHKPRMRRYWTRVKQEWLVRRHPPYTELASWYNDAGGTACGFHAYLGVANKSLPCGTEVVFSYHGRLATAVVQDRGPYVGGRKWDLNEGLAGALGFSGVDYVQVSIQG
jgi:rare lipoprotein A (peptidoglycan hydrolase)